MGPVEIISNLIKTNNGVLTTAVALNAGISRTTLGRLVQKGELERIAHGRYIFPDVFPDVLYNIQQRSSRIIFSHETALFLHDMAERTPINHSLTIPSSCKLSPSLAYDCKIYYVKDNLHDMGTCPVPSKAGHDVIAYNAERTICDVLRSRNRMDNQTLSAALKNYTARKNQDWKRLREYAEAFRITKLLRQYLEVLI